MEVKLTEEPCYLIMYKLRTNCEKKQCTVSPFYVCVALYKTGLLHSSFRTEQEKTVEACCNSLPR